MRSRLVRIFPEGLAGRGALVRDIAAKTVVTALFVGAVGDPDAAHARLLRPSMVAWMSDDALVAGRADPGFRPRWHDAALRSRRAVVSLLGRNALPHVPWYADNTREPIRDEILRVWRERYGAVRGRADLAPTSPAASMTLADDFAALFDPSLDGAELDDGVITWQRAHLDRAEQLRLLAQSRLDETTGRVRVALPGRGDRLLPPGASSALARAVLEELAPRLLGEPYVLAVCHAGDPTADDDRLELDRAGLSLEGSPALPDIIVLDVPPGVVWFVEIVVTGGEISDRRREQLVQWADERGLAADRCSFLTVYRSRSEAVFRRTVGSLAWGTLVWFADEPSGVLRLERLEAAGAS